MDGYGLRYFETLKNRYNDNIIVTIEKKGYTGITTEITITDLLINVNYKDFFTPAIGTGLELSIINNLPDWYQLEELLTAYNREFYIKIQQSGASYQTVVFEGYILANNNEQQLQKDSTISLQASNQIAQLSETNNIKYLTEGNGMHQLIYYLAGILQKTGLVYDYWINCSVYETSMNYGKLFTELYVNKHLFCDAEANYQDLLTVLNKILKSFNLFVYAFNQRWYIDRIFDSSSPRTYVQYDSEDIDDFAYYIHSGVTVTTITHFTGGTFNNSTDFHYVGGNPTIQYQAGYKEIEITTEYNNNANSLNESYSGASSHYYNGQTLPVIGKWYVDSNGYIMGTTGSTVQFHNGAEAMFKGLYTNIIIYKDDDNTTFNLSYKRRLTATELALYNSGELAVMIFQFNIIDWAHSGGGEQLVYDADGGTWSTASTDLDGGSAYTTFDVSYDNERKIYYCELNLTPEIKHLDGNGWHYLELRILGAKSGRSGVIGYNYDWNPTYLDLKATQDIALYDDSTYTGSISDNYYSKLSESIQLFDTSNYYTTNALEINNTVYTGVTSYTSSNWQDARTVSKGLRNLSLQKLYLEAVMQQYNKPRKVLKADIIYKYPLQPFSIIRDKNNIRDDKIIDLVLMGYEYDVCACKYTITAQEVVSDDDYIIPE